MPKLREASREAQPVLPARKREAMHVVLQESVSDPTALDREGGPVNDFFSFWKLVWIPVK
jgi:hypothetical protein